MPGMSKADTVQAITKSFRQHGYEGATMSVLEEMTGLARSSLYHHFPEGKTAMARDALAGVVNRFENEPLQMLNGEKPVQTRLRQFAKALRAYYEEGSLGCVIAAFSHQGTPPVVREQAGELATSWATGLSRAYEEHGMKRSVARAQAKRAIAELQGALILANVTGDQSYFDLAIDHMCTLDG
jgi:TetR/AcrR family transcriptional regulator, lmrAB and yxaGH operons repressor